MLHGETIQGRELLGWGEGIRAMARTLLEELYFGYSIRVTLPDDDEQLAAMLNNGQLKFDLAECTLQLVKE